MNIEELLGKLRTKEDEISIWRTQFFPPASGLDDQIHLLWVSAGWRLSNNVRREVAAYLRIEDFLVRVGGSQVAVFHPWRRTWSRPLPLSRPIGLSSNTVFAIVDKSTVFCCGFNHMIPYTLRRGISYFKEASKYTNKAVLLHLTTDVANVEKLPKMHDIRACPGVLAYEKTIYVFGDRTTYAAKRLTSQTTAEIADKKSTLRTCEAFSLGAERKWTLLPSMTYGRSQFNPVLSGHQIYLSSKSHSPLIEVFDLSSRSFAASLSFNVHFGNSPQCGDVLLISPRPEESSLPAALSQCYLYGGFSWTPAEQLVSAKGYMYYLDTKKHVHQLRAEGNRVHRVSDFDRSIEGCEKIWRVGKAGIEQYDPVTSAWFGLKSASIDLNAEINFTKVDEDTLFCCSDQEATSQVYLLRIGKKVNVEYLPPLLQARKSPGLIAYKKALYVFGGFAQGGALISCEYFSTEWTSLPPMREGRHRFMPCAHEDCLYLAGGHTIEVFSVSAAAFTRCIDLPENSPAVTLVHGDELVVITKNWKSQLNLRQEDSALELESHSSSKDEDLEPVSQPVSYQGTWYYTTYDFTERTMIFHPRFMLVSPGLFGRFFLE